MNLTLSIDERTLTEARRVAGTMGKSLNQLIRDFLSRLTAQDDVERDIAQFELLSEPPQGNAEGWKFDREELYEERT